MTDEVRDAGTEVLVALATLRGIPEDAWLGVPVTDLGIELVRLRALIELCKERAEWVEDSLAAAMEDDNVPIVGVGVARRSRELRSSWRYPEAGEQMRDDLLRHVATAIATDTATGVIDEGKRNVAGEALRLAYQAIPAFSSLKKAGANYLKLRNDDYRTYEPYYRVTIEEPL